jgi:hypothetical protein
LTVAIVKVNVFRKTEVPFPIWLLNSQTCPEVFRSVEVILSVQSAVEECIHFFASAVIDLLRLTIRSQTASK